MKRWLIVLSLTLFLAAIAALLWNKLGDPREATGGTGKGYSLITSSQVTALLKDQKDLQIVDLREPSLFKKGHIPGAINIPFDDFKKRMNELSTSKTIIFVCHTGPMGDVTSQMMVEKGAKKVFNLEGGMGRWNGPLTQ
ncbi:rhodanese-like domain-containing protein [Effusibacillus lacus]|uniref:Rhodanese-like domain-containing protein n=1 Tax=Effusibacillus lacus TaxID=1348429 RepID=A0A292YS93_9BACL|nr:rhodanese-like domain-containing protein [Effusibacillus lacus]TCS74974.1 rhodanese-related sulfurtransferase [Effusibacillus lacus]GAX91643.1 rhodanese-like domain-containing protein [Effusibacillus lacus]